MGRIAFRARHGTAIHATRGPRGPCEALATQISKPSVATLHAQTVTDPYTYVSSASSDATTAGFDLYGSPNATCVMLVPFGGASFAFITPWDTESYAKKKHGLAVSIGSLLRHRDGGSAPVSQKSPGSFDRDVKSRLSVAFDRHDAERSLSRSDAGRQLTVFEGLPRLHCPGDDQLDIQHGNFAVCLQCGPVANSGLGYGKLG